MQGTLDCEALAREIKAAQDGALQIEPFTSRWPAFDLAEAYVVADRVHRARMAEGARPVGRKIGFTNPDMWALYGVRQPVWAFMYDRTVRMLPAAHHVCPLARFAEPKIEPEIVFGFHASPRAGASVRELLESIEWVAHGFEIVQSNFPGWKFRAPDTVADASLHGMLLVGETRPLRDLGGEAEDLLANLEIDLCCNGRLIETGRGSNVLGSPLQALQHLLAVLADQPYAPLAAGEIVSTGTVTTARSVRAGETWSSAIRGIALPGLSVEFVS